MDICSDLKIAALVEPAEVSFAMLRHYGGHAVWDAVWFGQRLRGVEYDWTDPQASPGTTSPPRSRPASARRPRCLAGLPIPIGDSEGMGVTEQLLRYWSAHGRPGKLTTFPAGEVGIVRRGSDDVIDDNGKPARLQRYSVSGLAWGRETIWMTGEGRLAAWNGTDAEFDHFEAARTGFTLTIPKLVRSAAADGMSALQELSRLSAAPSEVGTVAYAGGRLIDGTGAPAVTDAVVVVKNGRILAAGPRGKVAVPRDARVVELGGKTILPGLWDMHAHFAQVEWGPIYLAAGITTVRDCGNEQDFIVSVRDTVDAGKGLGPRILLACFVDGPGPATIGTQILSDQSEIPALIKRFRDDRCAQVKIYQNPAAPAHRAARKGRARGGNDRHRPCPHRHRHHGRARRGHGHAQPRWLRDKRAPAGEVSPRRSHGARRARASPR
jgi:hypothetical protein